MPSHNKKGRSHEPRHIRLYHRMTGSLAWQHLSGNAIKVLIALIRMDNGEKNGELFLSRRFAAQLTGLADKTAQKALKELQELGFIRATAEGSFSQKQALATSWRLTWQPWPGHCGPTNEWEKWEPCNKLRGQNFPASGVKFPETLKSAPVTGVKITPVNDASIGNCTKSPRGKSTPQLIIPGGTGDAGQEDCNALRIATRAWLERTGWSQKQLASRSGLSQSKLSRFLDLTSQRRLTSDQFDRLQSAIVAEPRLISGGRR